MSARRLAVAALGTGLLALAACGGGSSSSDSPSSAAASPALHQQGRWIVDTQGRVVILHGVNEMNKAAPFYPSAIGFDADDIAFIAAQGFNVVRTAVMWEGYEPSENQYDEGYLDHVSDTVDALAAAGIYTLLDFHQDMYNEKYAGNSFPGWAALDDGTCVMPQGKTTCAPDFGFPENYFLNPALQTAYDNFFFADKATADGSKLQEHFAATWQRAARHFAGQPMIVGYDLMNEPAPGTSFLLCSTPLGCQPLDAPLTAFYKKVIPAIRAVDTTHTLYYEPWQLFNLGAQTYVGDLGDSNLGMSWHDYCLDASATAACNDTDELAYKHAIAEGAERNVALLMSEFGDSRDTPTLQRLADLADQNMMPWIFWAYNDRIVVAGNAPTGSNVYGSVLDGLVRPYPQLISGTPLHYGFDTGSKTFSFEYTPQRVDGQGSFAAGAVTRIFVPARQYPNGYGVTLSGGTVVSAPNATMLEIEATADDVQLSLTPH